MKSPINVPEDWQLSGLLVSVIEYGPQSVLVGMQVQPLHPFPLPPLKTPCTVDEPPRNPAGQVPCAAMDVPYAQVAAGTHIAIGAQSESAQSI
ncbi:MAG TPA: hypothetical protein VFK05_20425 [Polyangiaceae bacterium]|nr:hypothetical protein [Polyangiaceae bacterium]